MHLKEEEWRWREANELHFIYMNTSIRTLRNGAGHCQGHGEESLVTVADVDVSRHAWKTEVSRWSLARALKQKYNKIGFSQQCAPTCGNTIEFGTALGELACLTTDIRILLFGIQCCTIVACEPKQGVMGFTAEVA